MNITMSDLGKKIKKLREFYGMTQKRLGELLDYSGAQISYIESGDRNVNFDDLKKIANLFNVSVEMFSMPMSIGNNHFRSSKTENSGELVDEEMLKDFIKFANQQN